jgi:hypothetical protein
MNTTELLAEIDKEISRLQQVKNLLGGGEGIPSLSKQVHKKRVMSAEARAKIAAAAAIWFVGPEFLAVAGESVAMETAEGGTLAGGLAVAHIGEAVGTAAVAPILMTADGISGIASNCY